LRSLAQVLLTGSAFIIYAVILTLRLTARGKFWQRKTRNALKRIETKLSGRNKIVRRDSSAGCDQALVVSNHGGKLEQQKFAKAFFVAITPPTTHRI
jgi:hypothetical protein